MVSQKQLGITIEPEETGTTFAENALIKAETICKACGLPTIADDSGLCVDALGGAPGVYSARYCGRHGDDEANNDKLLDAMQAVPAGQRGAKFVSAVCFILPDGRHLTCMGECPGSIAFERLCGDYGFGYDPLFIPTNAAWARQASVPNTEGRSYAQLNPPTKRTPSATAGTRWPKMEKKLPEFFEIKGETTMLTSKQRAILRGKANTMDPVFQVGKGEIDETMIQGVKDCLDARELIKVKVLDNSMYNAREASVLLAEATGADCVQVIGSKFVLYLQKKNGQRLR